MYRGLANDMAFGIKRHDVSCPYGQHRKVVFGVVEAGGDRHSARY